MATTLLFVSGKILSFKNDGTPNAGGKIYFYDPGTSDPKDTFSDYDLVTVNAHPVVLDSAGRGIAYFSGDADVTVTDSDDVTLYTQDNVNPPEETVTVHLTTETTLDATHSGKWITTTDNIVLPLASAAGSGWLVYLKNLSGGSITVSRTGSGDTLNNALSSLTIPDNQSVVIATNDGLTGYDIFLNPLLEIGEGTSSQVLSYTSAGPAWTTVDLVNAGSDLYLYHNFS